MAFAAMLACAGYAPMCFASPPIDFFADSGGMQEIKTSSDQVNFQKDEKGLTVTVKQGPEGYPGIALVPVNEKLIFRSSVMSAPGSPITAR